MQKKINRDHSFLKRKASWVCLFAFAFLLLVVSCPVKKFLLSNFSHDTASLVHETNNHKSSRANFVVENTHCSLATDHFFNTDFHPLKILSPVFFLNNPNVSGFKINYFLTGLNDNYDPFATNKNSSVPLFLQHLRLLI